MFDGYADGMWRSWPCVPISIFSASRRSEREWIWDAFSNYAQGPFEDRLKYLEGFE